MDIKIIILSLLIILTGIYGVQAEIQNNQDGRSWEEGGGPFHPDYPAETGEEQSGFFTLPETNLSEIQTDRQYIISSGENKSDPPSQPRPWMGFDSGQNPGRGPDPFTPFSRLLISTGVMIAILILVSLAGLKIGTLYQYDCCSNTQKWIGIGHFVSAILIACPIWILYTIQTDNADQFFLATMYALFGILIYLFLSSLIQGISLCSGHPLPPVNYVHILFVFIAISLILMGRVPFFPPLPNTIMAISFMFLPGAVVSLLSGQIIHRKTENPVIDPAMTLTNPGSGIKNQISLSFPDSLLSRYHDISIIGSGGVARVYRALRNSDGEQVAVKIPISPDETSGKTFLNEMAIWRELHHPCIVEVFDQNIFPVPYVEMEFLGRSLRDITYPLSPERAYAIIQDIASALMYAHGKGVIHRDIKPGNVLLTDEGRAKLTDWGLSRSLYRADETKNTSFSLYYATPEQLAPETYGNGDQRTDIYQLGVLLYEVICGEPPYMKSGIGEIFMAIQQNSYRLPSACNPALVCFDPIIIRSLQADPDKRFNTIEEFISSLSVSIKDMTSS